MPKHTDLIIKVFQENSGTSFFGMGGNPSETSYGRPLRCSGEDGEVSDQNWMVVDGGCLSFLQTSKHIFKKGI